MKAYLTTLIEEKGHSIDDEITIEGHFGVTYEMLLDFIEGVSPADKKQIKNTLVKIDFLNGDVFHFLDHLGRGMIASVMAA